MLRLKDRVAIVSGGAGAIGHAICRALAKEGARVVVFDVSAERAEKVADDLRAEGGQAEHFAVDVSDYGSVSAAVDTVARNFGGIQILVNCAGGSAREKMTEFHKQSIDVIHWMLDVNLYGALHCIRAVAPHMVDASSGCIISVASIVAQGGKKGCVEYGAAKGGIIAATKSLAIELGAHNISVNCVSPGLVNRGAVSDEQAFARKHSHVNRLCTQDDVARAVLFFALPESDYITGQNLAVDGGRSLGLKGDR